MTIPNCISLFRIFLVPCFAWVFLTASLPEDFTLAAVLLVLGVKYGDDVFRRKAPKGYEKDDHKN